MDQADSSYRGTARALSSPAGAGVGAAQTTGAQISEVVLAEHARALRLFGALDDTARSGDPAARSPVLGHMWARIAALLEFCAAAEEEICFPVLFGRGAHVSAMLEEALADHNDIRETVEEARLAEPGSPRWWRAVTAARTLAADHFASEEPGLLAEVRSCLQPETATILARQWTAFAVAHEGGHE